MADLIPGIPGLKLGEEIWKLGRLEDGEESTLKSVGRGKYLRMGSGLLRWPVGGSSRPVSSEGRQTFHWSHGYVSKTKTGEPLEYARAHHPDRTYLWPERGEVARIREAGGRYDRKARAWYVRADGRAALGRETVARMTSAPRGAGGAGKLGGAKRAGKGSWGTAASFQAYIERAHHGDRRAEIEDDDQGPISFGTVGETGGERRAFWEAVARRERANGCIQLRIIAELPHEVSPAERRSIAEAAVAPLEARGLVYHAAVHLPDVSRGMDPRNVHLHVVYHDRPLIRRRAVAEARAEDAPRFEFASHKDRGARGPAWMRALRAVHCEAMNGSLERTDEALISAGQAPTGKRYDARTYREMGIDKEPTRHLGPVNSAFERAGRPTVRGALNLLSEAAHARDSHDRALLARAALAGGLMDLLERRSVATSDAARRREDELRARLRDARDALAIVATPPAYGNSRALLRERWLQSESRRLRRRLDGQERSRSRLAVNRAAAPVAGPGGLSLEDLAERADYVDRLLVEIRGTTAEGRGREDNVAVLSAGEAAGAGGAETSAAGASERRDSTGSEIRSPVEKPPVEKPPVEWASVDQAVLQSIDAAARLGGGGSVRAVLEDVLRRDAARAVAAGGDGSISGAERSPRGGPKTASGGASPVGTASAVRLTRMFGPSLGARLEAFVPNGAVVGVGPEF